MEDNKTFSMSKKGLVWYTLLSFLLVTFLIFLAVMITYNSTVENLGGMYAERLALESNDLALDEVSDLKNEKTFLDGKNVFKVTFNKEETKHTVYIDVNTAGIVKCETNGDTPAPVTPEGEEFENHEGTVNERIYR